MKEPTILDIFFWWLGWVLLDYVPKSWSTNFNTRRYKIFKWCFSGFENYIYWYVKRWEK